MDELQELIHREAGITFTEADAAEMLKSVDVNDDQQINLVEFLTARL